MLWGCFDVSGTSTLYKVDEIMKEEDYFQILHLLLKSTVRQLKLGHNWVYRQVSDPKHQNWFWNS